MHLKIWIGQQLWSLWNWILITSVLNSLWNTLKSPEESYRVWCVWVWPDATITLYTYSAYVEKGQTKKKRSKLHVICIYILLILISFMILVIPNCLLISIFLVSCDLTVFDTNKICACTSRSEVYQNNKRHG